jgi:putative peptidoglycan lipid II flippase
MRHFNTNKLIFAVFTAGTLSLISRVFFVLRDMMIARQYGTGKEADNYYLSIMAPLLICGISSAAIQFSLVPQFAKDGTASRRKVYKQVSIMSTLIIFFLFFIITCAHQIIFHSTLSHGEIFLIYLALPTIILMNLNSVGCASLIAIGKTKTASAISAISPISQIILMSILPSKSNYLTIYFILSSIIEFLIVSLLVYKISETSKEQGQLTVVEVDSDPVIFNFNTVGSMQLIAVGLQSGITFIAQICALSQGQGGLSSFQYASKIVALPLGVMQSVVAIVVLPFLSMSGNSLSDNIYKRYIKGQMVIIICAVIITAVMYVLTPSLVPIALGSKAIPKGDLSNIINWSRILGLQIPFYLFSAVAFKVLVSMRMDKLMMVVTLLNFITALISLQLLAKWYGLTGICLGIDLTYLISALLLQIVIIKLSGERGSMRQLLSHFKRWISGKTNWSHENAFDPAWKSRIGLMYGLICNNGTISDFGCGPMWLRELIDLKRHSYTPIDFIKRSDDTIVYDVNKDAFPRGNHNIIFLSGFFEYVLLPEKFIKEVSSELSVKELVMSYVPIELVPGIANRTLLGWKNHMPLADVISLITNNGFSLNYLSKFNENYIMRFSRV